MATTLRKVIINRCIELERKYKTVERTTKSVDLCYKTCNFVIFFVDYNHPRL